MNDPITQKTFLVIESYHRSNDDPIVMRRGDSVTVGRDFTEDPDWPGWTWCRNADGKEGWVPRSLVRISGSNGTAREDYDARELSVQKGERLSVSKVLNGWAWAQRQNGETGWLPLRHLQALTAPSS